MGISIQMVATCTDTGLFIIQKQQVAVDLGTIERVIKGELLHSTGGYFLFNSYEETVHHWSVQYIMDPSKLSEIRIERVRISSKVVSQADTFVPDGKNALYNPSHVTVNAPTMLKRLREAAEAPCVLHTVQTDQTLRQVPTLLEKEWSEEVHCHSWRKLQLDV